MFPNRPRIFLSTIGGSLSTSEAALGQLMGLGLREHLGLASQEPALGTLFWPVHQDKIDQRLVKPPCSAVWSFSMQLQLSVVSI